MLDKLIIPQSNILVSRIAIGGNIFGHFADKRTTQLILETAERTGINFIDTADVYSSGLSETLIGDYLKHSKANWVIASKVGLESNANPSGLGKRKLIRSRCEASLLRLKRESIDLLQMHHFDDETPISETVETLQALKKEGKIKLYGVSNYNKHDIKEIADASGKSEGGDCSTAQIPFNIFEQGRYESIVEECVQRKIGILPYNVLARGVLSGKYTIGKQLPEKSRATSSDSVRASLSDKILNRITTAIKLCKEHDTSLIHAIVQWTIKQKGVLSLPIGVRSSDQLSNIASALNNELEDSFLQDLEATLLDGLNYMDTKNLVSPLSRSFD